MCLIATFDTYDEAWVHEQRCTNYDGSGTNNNNGANGVVSSNTNIISCSDYKRVIARFKLDCC